MDNVRVRNPRPVLNLQNREDFRQLNVRLGSGECKLLYTGVEVYNSGNSTALLVIRTPKVPEYEQMRADFFSTEGVVNDEK